MVLDPSHRRNSEKNTVSSSSAFLVLSPLVSFPFLWSVHRYICLLAKSSSLLHGKNEVRSNKEAEAKLALLIVEGKTQGENRAVCHLNYTVCQFRQESVLFGEWAGLLCHLEREQAYCVVQRVGRPTVLFRE